MSDGADDDPQLRALRAVWLSLPDEEPPANGLAQLMAAARVKAEEMARPSPWRRILDLLRRPSMLAFATILLLIGGVVILGQRHDSLDTAPPALSIATTTQVERQTSGPLAGSSSSPVPVVRADEAPEAKAESTTIAAPPPPHHDAPPKVTKAPPRTPSPDKALHRRETVTEHQGVATGGEAPLEATNLRSEDPSKGKVESDTTNVPGKLSKTKTPSAPPDGLATAPTLEADDEVVTSKETKSRSEAPISQLLAQCRTAAARGDCTAVRTIAQRIAKQNATFYRDHVSKDVMLNKCLAAEAQ